MTDDETKTILVADTLCITPSGQAMLPCTFSIGQMADTEEGAYLICGFQEIVYKRGSVRKVHVIVKDTANVWYATSCAGWLMRATIRDATTDEVKNVQPPPQKHLRVLHLSAEQANKRELRERKPSENSKIATLPATSTETKPKKKRKLSASPAKSRLPANKEPAQENMEPSRGLDATTQRMIQQAVQDAMQATSHQMCAAMSLPVQTMPTPAPTAMSTSLGEPVGHASGITLNFQFVLPR